MLGKEIGTIYSKDELKRLIAIHVENPEAQLESGLTQDDSQLLSGVLEYKVLLMLLALKIDSILVMLFQGFVFTAADIPVTMYLSGPILAQMLSTMSA